MKMKMNLPTRKEMNLERMERIAERVGDGYLSGSLFWMMFEDLTASKQEEYIKIAEKIEKEEL